MLLRCHMYHTHTEILQALTSIAVYAGVPRQTCAHPCALHTTVTYAILATTHWIAQAPVRAQYQHQQNPNQSIMLFRMKGDSYHYCMWVHISSLYNPHTLFRWNLAAKKSKKSHQMLNKSVFDSDKREEGK